MSQQELYRIVDRGVATTLTSGDTAVTYNSETYVPTPMGRGQAESKAEMSRASLETTFGMDDTTARKYLIAVGDTVVTLTVFSKDAETGNVTVVWKGRLTSVKPEMTTIKLVWESVYTSLRRPGLRRRFQKNCSFVLYGRGCFVNKALFATTGTVTVVSGANVTCAAAATKPDGYFLGGMIQVPDGTLRFITGHTGNQLALIRPIESLNAAIGGGPVAVTIYPGCDRSRDTCNSRFNNLLNNGSTPFIPIINPYGGTPFA